MTTTRSASLPRPRRAGLAALALLAIAVIAGFPGDRARASTSVRALCASAVDAAETRARIPRQLMTAISLAESGRWFADRSASVAWPWTVTSGKDSWYLPDKARAIAQVRRLRERGVTNIDVGCMQINLRYHPDAFGSIEEALDPHANARYAADLLTRLNDAHKSWGEAIRHYHSATRSLNRPYHEKVVRLWNDARRVATVERREVAVAALEERREKERARRAAAEAKRQAVIEAYRQERLRRALGQVASN